MAGAGIRGGVVHGATDEIGREVIEGHTDSRGSDRYNLRLSQGRANSVRSYLIRRGIDPVRMEAVGYGEQKPIGSNRTRAGRAQNRRVEFFITSQ